jgi:hypothetical protein
MCLRVPSGNDPYNKPDCHFANIGLRLTDPPTKTYDWMVHNGPDKQGGLARLEHKFICEFCGHENIDIFIPAGLDPVVRAYMPMSLILEGFKHLLRK